MRAFLGAALAALLVAPGVLAQTVPPRGADATFDVATWNLEFFGAPTMGPSDAAQLRNVTAVMEQADIDLWGVQEVVDPAEWSELLDALQDDGYAGLLGPSVSSDPTFDQKLAFIYDRSVVQVIGSRTILGAYAYEFGYRLPFEMQARVTVSGVTRTLYVIVFHAKASTGTSDYNRRAGGAAALKDYVDGRIARGEEVIVLGDFNDYLVGSTRGGGYASPYDAFVQDTDYVAATLPLQQGGVNTYCTSSTCSSGDTRDHLLFTAGLADVYIPDSADHYGELITTVPSYVYSTSDHLPVIVRFGFGGTDAALAPDAAAAALLAPAPSPFRTATTLRFRLDAPADVALDVVDVLGRRVAATAGTYGVGEHAVALDGRDLAPGLYVVRLRAGDVVRTQTLVRTR